MNKYIDIHTHVLPGMGCGPETPAESLAMLRALQEHGVKTVIATPFFNPETEPAERLVMRVMLSSGKTDEIRLEKVSERGYCAYVDGHCVFTASAISVQAVAEKLMALVT